MPKGYAYIASPYSSGIREQLSTAEFQMLITDRYYAVRNFTGWCLINKIFVYSPIVHCHDLANKFNLPKDAGFWKEYNEALLLGAQKLIVLCLDGWKESEGVQQEIEMARELWYPIALATFNPDEDAPDSKRYTIEQLPLKGSHRKASFLA